VVEYVDLTMALTTNGGQSDGSFKAFTEISPSCSASNPPTPCDDNPRFIAPFEADAKPGAGSHWVAGGRYVWDNQGKGWATRCAGSACDWKVARDLGADRSTTGIGVYGPTIYAGWCGPCNPSRSSSTGEGFASGIDTNVSGSWQRIAAPVNRIITSFWIDPTDTKHVIAVASGYSSTWVESAGVGHVFESTNGGTAWNDVSGDPVSATGLPDSPGDDVLVTPSGKIVVATDVGVFVADKGTTNVAKSWSRLGSNLPNVVASDISFTSDGKKILVATYGRGLWTVPTP